MDPQKKSHTVTREQGEHLHFIFVYRRDASFIAQDGLISVFFPGSNSPLQRHLMKFLTTTTREAHQNGGGETCGDSKFDFLKANWKVS